MLATVVMSILWTSKYLPIVCVSVCLAITRSLRTAAHFMPTLLWLQPPPPLLCLFKQNVRSTQMIWPASFDAAEAIRVHLLLRLLPIAKVVVRFSLATFLFPWFGHSLKTNRQ